MSTDYSIYLHNSKVIIIYETNYKNPQLYFGTEVVKGRLKSKDNLDK